VTVHAPDPDAVRRASVAVIDHLRLPRPASMFPLVWEPGDGVDVRPRAALEGRMAILNVVLARSFGMAADRALRWLLDAHLVDQMTVPEWRYVLSGAGDPFSFALHLEAVHGLAWVMGLVDRLDPAEPSTSELLPRLPNLPAEESFGNWRGRTLTQTRDPAEVAAQLDLHYCLDWAYLEAERQHLPLPGLIDSNAIGQRRWALEWAVVFSGPYHEAPVPWEKVDLSV
jgi:hypothetical protein